MPRKAGMSGSEGGRRKRTRLPGTSSAAYPTASPVREETDGKGPGQGHLAGGRLHSMRRGLETEHPAMVTQRSGPQGKPGEEWLRDLTPDNATAPAPDPTRYIGGQTPPWRSLGVR